MKHRLVVSISLVFLACGPPDVPNLYNPGATIVCLGDSITAGVGTGDQPAYPELLARRLGAPVIDAGVPGDTTADALARLPEALAHDPWLVIVEVGGNDLLRRVPAGRIEANLRRIVEGVLEAGAVPLLVELEGGFLVGNLEDVFERLEDDYGVPLVEDVLDDVLTDSNLKSDQIHPNAAGHVRLADAVADEVEVFLQARRRRP